MYVWFSIEIPQFVQIDQATWLPETIQVSDWLKIQNLKKSEVQMNCNLVHMFMRSSTKILHFVLNLQKHGCHGWSFKMSVIIDANAVYEVLYKYSSFKFV